MRRVGAFVASIVLLVVAFGIVEYIPTLEDKYHPFVVEGKSGRTTNGGTFTVKVVRPIPVRQIRLQEGIGDEVTTLRTKFLWVIVPVKLDATKKALRVQGATIHAKSGKVYAVSKRIPSSHNPSDAFVEPGIRRLGGWVFEMPASEVVGSTLYVSANTDPELERQVRIPIDADEKLMANPGKSFDLPEVLPEMPKPEKR